jgi:hypothetical protein
MSLKRAFFAMAADGSLLPSGDGTNSVWCIACSAPVILAATKVKA